jgi:hypothetical protein
MEYIHMSELEFSPESWLSFRLIADWYFKRFHKEINIDISKNDTKPVVFSLHEREMKKVEQSNIVAQIDFEKLIKMLSDNKNITFELCKELYTAEFKKKTEEWHNSFYERNVEIAQNIKKQLHARPKQVTDQYLQYYDYLSYFSKQLMKLGLRNGDPDNRTSVAMQMHSLLNKFEFAINHDRKTYIDEPLWEENLKIILKFLSELHPLGLDRTSYLNIISNVLYHFSNSVKTRTGFISKQVEEKFKITKKTFWRDVFLIQNLYNPLEKFARRKDFKFKLIDNHGIEIKSTRDEWILNLYNTLVIIKKMEFRLRNLTTTIKKLDSPSTLKSIASRFNKNDFPADEEEIESYFLKDL